MYKIPAINLLPTILAIWTLFVSVYAQGTPPFQFVESCGKGCGAGQCTAGIFTRSKSQESGGGSYLNNLNFLHSGAIVHPSAVLTVLKTNPDVANFVDENGNLLAEIQIVAGKTTKTANGKTGIQIREVDAIIPYLNPSADLNYAVVLLHLRTPLDIESLGVRLACLPLIELFPALLRSEPDSSVRHTTVRGFASRGKLEERHNPIRFLQLMYNLSPSECERGFSAIYPGNYQHIYCSIGYTEATENVCASRGSSDYIHHDGRLFVNGLAVLVPEPQKACDRNHTFFFYSLLQSGMDLQKWMSSSMKCLSMKMTSCPSGECIEFHKICNGRMDCADGSGFDENPAICSYAKRSGILNEQPAAPGNPPENPVTGATCPIFQYAPGVAVRCTKDDSDISCRQAPVHTKMELFCKPFYVSNTRILRHEMTCDENGTWTPYKAFLCKADCGRIESSARRSKPLISNGNHVSRRFAFPWYAAIFVRSERTKRFEYICGASLIESSVVATAAHCVTDNSGRKTDVNVVRIVLAPTSSIFDENSEENGSKTLRVNAIWVPRTFDFVTLSSDIALVRLSESVEFTPSIQPVCYLTETQIQVPAAGSLGLIVGFGKDETGKVSDSLKWIPFPVVSNEECEKAFGGRIESNEYCAGYTNGTAACEGDSGGGMVFKQYITASESPYVLKGIVSRGIASDTGECVTTAVSVFTHFDAFGAWILETLTSNDIF